MKKYNLMFNVGMVKYVVNTYDGVQTHKDGSPFWGISCFSNKKKRDLYIKDLEKQGYIGC
jgi:hypothetical protein